MAVYDEMLTATTTNSGRTIRDRTRDQPTDEAAEAAIEQACRFLRLPTIRSRFVDVAALRVDTANGRFPQFHAPAPE